VFEHTKGGGPGPKISKLSMVTWFLVCCGKLKCKVVVGRYWGDVNKVVAMMGLHIPKCKPGEGAGA
jgi:hypothetical protein